MHRAQQFAVKIAKIVVMVRYSVIALLKPFSNAPPPRLPSEKKRGKGGKGRQELLPLGY